MLHPNATASRLAYLREVAKAGVYKPRHGSAASNCTNLGWVEPIARKPDGTTANLSAIENWDGVEWAGQQLTAEGRKILARAILTEEPPSGQ